MKTEHISCPLCGYSFDPSGKAACSACPINKGCHMVCCPNCGYTTIDPGQSKVVQFAHRLLNLKMDKTYERG